MGKLSFWFPLPPLQFLELHSYTRHYRNMIATTICIRMCFYVDDGVSEPSVDCQKIYFVSELVPGMLHVHRYLGWCLNQVLHITWTLSLYHSAHLSPLLFLTPKPEGPHYGQRIQLLPSYSRLFSPLQYFVSLPAALLLPIAHRIHLSPHHCVRLLLHIHEKLLYWVGLLKI